MQVAGATWEDCGGLNQFEKYRNYNLVVKGGREEEVGQRHATNPRHGSALIPPDRACNLRAGQSRPAGAVSWLLAPAV